MAATLLILGARAGQLQAIRTAKAMGLHTVVIDPAHEAPGFAYATEGHRFDLADTQACLDIARGAAVDGVMTIGADFPIPMLATICEAMDLPGLTPAAAARATNKRLMREALVAAGVPCPASHPAADSQQARAAFAAVGGEAIVKPARGSGGRGITRVRAGATDDLEAAFERSLACTHGDGVLVEEFVEGPEFSVEAITFGGETAVLTVTDKQTTGSPYYVEVGHTQPTAFRDQAARLIDVAVRAVLALGIDGSPSHTELRLGPDGPVVIEVGARLGGGFICSDLTPLSTGIDPIAANIRMALGETPDLGRKHDRGAAIRFLQPAPGTVTGVAGVEQASALPGCHRIRVEVAPGDLVQPLRDADGRVGYVIFDGADAAEAAQRADVAVRLVEIRTESP